jgi:hypothetical protein
MGSKKRQQRGIHIVKPKRNDPETLVRESMSEKFKTGEIVPHSGIYHVTHAEHRLPHEVTLLRANNFPPCAQCGNKVTFKLLRGVAVNRFAVTLNAIPEMLEETQSFLATLADDDAEKAG